ncbi:MAG: SUMF1/EgtB/PvdO family nonheme iron enzyme, partial [Anaerolineaceae bacterium]|nr:SUMF1/EgtB/PvdO family nonheme iron enzyme [Anaerolineaceae bacterium]
TEAETTVTTLTGEKDELLTKLTEAETTVTTLTGEKDELQTKLTEAETTVTTLTGEKDELQTKLTEAETIVTALTGEKDELKKTDEGKNDFLTSDLESSQTSSDAADSEAEKTGEISDNNPATKSEDVIPEKTNSEEEGEGEQIILINLMDANAVPIPDESKGSEPEEHQEETEDDTIQPIVHNIFTDPLSGIEMLHIPAGTFLYGPAEEQTEIQLDAYWIGQTEVTNAQYRKCVEAGYCEDSAMMDIYNWKTADQPVNYVTYRQAQRFCKWIGGKLPSEQQWEKAARGTNGQIYPWGNEAPTETNRYANIPGENSDIQNVGVFPNGASPYGVLDMTGNVWEWTSTGFDSDQNTQADTSDKEYVIRGGSASPSETDEAANTLRTDYRGHSAKPNYFLGFRCVIPDSGV